VKLLKKCPTYHKCQEIWGERANVVIPHKHGTTQIGRVNPNNDEGSQGSFGLDDDDFNLNDELEINNSNNSILHCSS